jgi:GT2 family glycosyltransferase
LKCFHQIRPFVGGAIDLGIKKAKKKYIVIMASDLETNPYDLKKMLNLSLKNRNCIVSADRWIGKNGFKDYGIIKFIANFMFQKLLKVFFSYNILDFTFAYRIYPKKH